MRREVGGYCRWKWRDGGDDVMATTMAKGKTVAAWQAAATMADRAMVASEQSGLRESRG